uniref:Uncharacterized protein n=1 Tax=Rhizophora mucronata TaxID=61149 RepID=A0A2P2J452_RHIMU
MKFAQKRCQLPSPKILSN